VIGTIPRLLDELTDETEEAELAELTEDKLLLIEDTDETEETEDKLLDIEETEETEELLTEEMLLCEETPLNDEEETEDKLLDIEETELTEEADETSTSKETGIFFLKTGVKYPIIFVIIFRPTT